MIAGQQTEAAGIHRNAVMDAKLRREIRRSIALGQFFIRGFSVAVRLLEPRFAVHVRIERSHHTIHMRKKAVVLLKLLQALLVDFA